MRFDKILKASGHMVELTVIIPVYNAEKYIGKCIDSILSQSYQLYEVLLIDDGSTDNSLSICQEYEKKDKRIKVFHQKNEGPSSARNYGLRLAQGTYLTFIDADDYIMPTMFSELIRIMDDTSCDLVISPFTVEYVYFKNKKFLRPNLHFDGLLRNSKEDADKIFSLFEATIINSPCARIYKTEIIKTNHIFMPHGVNYMEDLIFNIDYLKCCESFYFFNKSFYFYTKKKFGSITSSYTDKLFQSINSAHDKALEYLQGNLEIKGQLERRAHYILIPNVLTSFLNLFYKDCPMTRTEKMAFIQGIVRDKHIMDKVAKSHKPGILPGLYKRLLETRKELVIYYTCKFYKYYKMWFQDVTRRTT